MATLEKIVYAEYGSGIGGIFIASRGGRVVRLKIGGEKEEFLESISRGCGIAPSINENAFCRVFKELDRYFKGAPVEFTTQVSLEGTPFELNTWAEIKKIPWGTACTYKSIANAAGHPNATRAVGAACGANPVPIIIPCHRVIRSDGSLGGYTGGIWIKKALLKTEGFF